MEGFFTAFTCLETKREKIGSFNVAHPSLSFILNVIIHENGMHLSRNSTSTYLALRLIATLMRFPMGLCTHHQRKSSEKFEKIDYVICISNRAWKKPNGNGKHFHYIFDIKEKDTQPSFLLILIVCFHFFQLLLSTKVLLKQNFFPISSKFGNLSLLEKWFQFQMCNFLSKQTCSLTCKTR